jgi:predicted small secreted protein
MRRRLLLALALLPALVLAACGGGNQTGGGYDTSAGGKAPVAFDPRTQPLRCIESNHVQAVRSTKPTEPNVLVIMPVTSGARITWLKTPTETESAQLSNQYPGSEMIGPAAFQVGSLSDKDAKAVEKCLEAQGSRF